jgi:hypothetical protein
MNRELALKIVLAVVGLLFIALGYPMVVFIRQDPALSMQFSLYVTLGIFLLLAIRDPSASRIVIAFTAWSSFGQAALMGIEACRNMVARGELIGVAVLVIIGAVLIALAPSSKWGSPQNRGVKAPFRSSCVNRINDLRQGASQHGNNKGRGTIKVVYFQQALLHTVLYGPVF